MLERLSIEWKLPLAICTVLMAVVAALSALAYHEVADSAQDAAAGRVENFAAQLATSLHVNVDKGLVRLGARASQEPLIEYLRSPERRAELDDGARAALEGLLLPLESSGEFTGVQLRDLEWRLLLDAGPDRERVRAIALDDLEPSTPPKTGDVGAMVALGERVVVPAFVTLASGEQPLGYVVRWAEVALSAETRAQVTGFLAPQASTLVGTPGGLWIDWERVVPEPTLGASAPGKAVRVERSGGAHLAAAAPIAGTPWIVVVEYPERLALAPASRFARRVGIAAGLLLVAGLAGVWVLARRITGPLRALTLASESLVGGPLAQPAATAGQDELDRLRVSFDRMSDRVREAHRVLEAKLAELREARAEAEAASARKDEFLAMLAHELRNPLSPIVFALSVVRSPRASAAAREEALAAIERQVHNVTRLVDDLLDVSRITRGRIELRRARCDVATLVRNALETTRPLIQSKGHRLSCDLPDRPLVVDVDGTRIEQVLANLLTNAAKYTEPGGNLRIGAGREGDDVVLRVRDDGIGIPAEKLDAVFELFHQVDRSIDRSRGGLGIGLTLARRLVELHGGSVTASSAGAGRGSEFVVRLPAGAAIAEGSAPSAAPGAPEPAGAALRILVVEDGQDGRQLLERMLALDGHDVRTAEDGPAGLARFGDFDPDAVLLDIGLPGLDGFEVARRMRAARGPDVLLVAVTGYGDADTRARALEVGFDAHLVKPIPHDKLRTVLARARARAASARAT